MLDSVISRVAQWLPTSSALEPSKLKLKEAAWAEYDPCFTHVGDKIHQSALELRPKNSNICRPMCPDFSFTPAHSAFRAVRVCMLSDLSLLVVVRDLLYASMLCRLPPVTAHSDSEDFPPPSHPHYPYYVLQKEWTLRCSDSVFAKSLQLLTLMVHNLSPYCMGQKTGQGVGEVDMEGVDGASFCSDSESGRPPTVQQRQHSFETFLMTPGKVKVKKLTVPQERPEHKAGIFTTTGSCDQSNTVTSTRITSDVGYDYRPGSLEEIELGIDIDSTDLPEFFSGIKDEDTAGEVSTVDLPPLLHTIMDIYDSLSSGGSDEDLFNKQSILWIIGKLESTLSSECGGMIEGRMKQV